MHLLESWIVADKQKMKWTRENNLTVFPEPWAWKTFAGRYLKTEGGAVFTLN